MVGLVEIEDTGFSTVNYDFQSLMHYHAGDPANPLFESRTGVPVPGEIGSQGLLTVSDKNILERLYPAAPVVRRSDGADGAGGVFQTSAIAVSSANNTAIVANAVQNSSGNYQLVLWRIRENGVVLRMADPPGATGGDADGSIVRLFDSGPDGPAASSVASVVLQATAAGQLVAILSADDSSKLVLSTWLVDGASIGLVPILDSKWASATLRA